MSRAKETESLGWPSLPTSTSAIAQSGQEFDSISGLTLPNSARPSKQPQASSRKSGPRARPDILVVVAGILNAAASGLAATAPAPS